MIRDIHWACAHVLGDKAAHDITMDMGVHWTRVAAMAAALKSHDPLAVKILKEWEPDTRRASGAQGSLAGSEGKVEDNG